MSIYSWNGTCSHKVAHDFCERQPDGSRIWTCSKCGKREPWGESWRYWGNIECSNCWATSMDAVACSEACAAGWPRKKPLAGGD